MVNNPHIVRIGEAAKAFGVSAETVHRWEISGKIRCERTPGGQRRYDLSALLPDKFRSDSPTRRTVADARVSSHDQSADLERQKQVLELYCAKQGWTFGIVADLGSGMNFAQE
jgi:excisionase family DNA binding protein